MIIFIILFTMNIAPSMHSAHRFHERLDSVGRLTRNNEGFAPSEDTKFDKQLVTRLRGFLDDLDYVVKPKLRRQTGHNPKRRKMHRERTLLDNVNADFDAQLINRLRNFVDELDVTNNMHTFRSKQMEFKPQIPSQPKDMAIFTSFLHDLAVLLLRLSTGDFETFVQALSKKMNTYFADKGNTFHEMIFDPRLEAFLMNSLVLWENTSVKVLQRDLKRMLYNRKKDAFTKFAETLNHIFSHKDAETLKEILTLLKNINKNHVSLYKIIDDALKFFFDDKFDSLSFLEKTVLSSAVTYLSDYISTYFNERTVFPDELFDNMSVFFDKTDTRSLNDKKAISRNSEYQTLRDVDDIKKVLLAKPKGGTDTTISDDDGTLEIFSKNRDERKSIVKATIDELKEKHFDDDTIKLETSVSKEVMSFDEGRNKKDNALREDINKKGSVFEDISGPAIVLREHAQEPIKDKKNHAENDISNEAKKDDDIIYSEEIDVGKTKYKDLIESKEREKKVLNQGDVVQSINVKIVIKNDKGGKKNIIADRKEDEKLISNHRITERHMKNNQGVKKLLNKNILRQEYNDKKSVSTEFKVHKESEIRTNMKSSENYANVGEATQKIDVKEIENKNILKQDRKDEQPPKLVPVEVAKEPKIKDLTKNIKDRETKQDLNVWKVENKNIPISPNLYRYNKPVPIVVKVNQETEIRKYVTSGDNIRDEGINDTKDVIKVENKNTLKQGSKDKKDSIEVQLDQESEMRQNGKSSENIKKKEAKKDQDAKNILEQDKDKKLLLTESEEELKITKDTKSSQTNINDRETHENLDLKKVENKNAIEQEKEDNQSVSTEEEDDEPVSSEEVKSIENYDTKTALRNGEHEKRSGEWDIGSSAAIDWGDNKKNSSEEDLRKAARKTIKEKKGDIFDSSENMGLDIDETAILGKTNDPTKHSEEHERETLKDTGDVKKNITKVVKEPVNNLISEWGTSKSIANDSFGFKKNTEGEKPVLKEENIREHNTTEQKSGRDKSISEEKKLEIFEEVKIKKYEEKQTPVLKQVTGLKDITKKKVLNDGIKSNFTKEEKPKLSLHKLVSGDVSDNEEKLLSTTDPPSVSKVNKNLEVSKQSNKVEKSILTIDKDLKNTPTELEGETKNNKALKEKHEETLVSNTSTNESIKQAKDSTSKVEEKEDINEKAIKHMTEDDLRKSLRKAGGDKTKSRAIKHKNSNSKRTEKTTIGSTSDSEDSNQTSVSKEQKTIEHSYPNNKKHKKSSSEKEKDDSELVSSENSSAEESLEDKSPSPNRKSILKKKNNKKLKNTKLKKQKHNLNLKLNDVRGTFSQNPGVKSIISNNNKNENVASETEKYILRSQTNKLKRDGENEKSNEVSNEKEVRLLLKDKNETAQHVSKNKGHFSFTQKPKLENAVFTDDEKSVEFKDQKSSKETINKNQTSHVFGSVIKEWVGGMDKHARAKEKKRIKETMMQIESHLPHNKYYTSMFYGANLEGVLNRRRKSVREHHSEKKKVLRKTSANPVRRKSHKQKHKSNKIKIKKSLDFEVITDLNDTMMTTLLTTLPNVILRTKEEKRRIEKKNKKNKAVEILTLKPYRVRHRRLNSAEQNQRYFRDSKYSIEVLPPKRGYVPRRHRRYRSDGIYGNDNRPCSEETTLNPALQSVFRNFRRMAS